MKNSIRIGIDGNEANVSERVGSNVYSFELIKAIEQLDKENEYTIYLKNRQRTDLPQKRKNFGYKVLKPGTLWTRWRLPLSLFTSSPRPDVFFSPGHYSPALSPIPVVATILDLSFLKYPQSFSTSVLHQLRAWTKQTIKKASHLLAISQSTKQDIVDLYNIDESKITVTYPGVNQRFRAKISFQAIESIRQKYQIKKKYIFTLGTLQPKKNIPKLIEAFSLINDPDLQLVIAGKVWHQFRDSGVKYPKTSSILELGFVPDEEIPILMKGAQAFVLPSLYEGFGIPVAEAMAIGTPVISSNLSSMPEIVGKNGSLVDPTNVLEIKSAIQGVLGLAPQKRVKLISQAKKQVEKFSWETCARKTLEVLYAVATKR